MTASSIARMGRTGRVATTLAVCLVGAHFAAGADVLLLIALAAATLVTFVGPLSLFAGIGTAAVLVAPGVTPVLVTLAGVDVRLTDLALVWVAIVAAMRGSRSAVMDRRVLWLTILMIGWGLLRTDQISDNASFVRLLSPLIMAWALPRLVMPRRMWSVTAVVAGILVLTAPYLTEPLVAQIPGSTRAAGWAGGPNQMGSVAAALLLIGWQFQGWCRWAAAGVSCLGLFYSRSLSSLFAAAVGLLVAQALSTSSLRRSRPFAPLLVLCALPTVALVGPKLRDDAGNTIAAHVALGRAIGRVLDAGNPLIGGGWQVLPPETTMIATLHSVYLDWLAFLGFLGLALLLAWLWALIRRSRDPTGISVTVMVVVWLNTSGAYPAPAWGLLALALAVTRQREPITPEASLEQPIGCQNRTRTSRKSHTTPTGGWHHPP